MQESTLQIGAPWLVLLAWHTTLKEHNTLQVPAVSALAAPFVADRLATRILPNCNFF
jgi:hypothetical protein